jgi:hypothetical protein
MRKVDYMLPEDTLQLRVLGCSNGCRSIMMVLHPELGHKAIQEVQGFVTNMPSDVEGMKAIAPKIADTLLQDAEDITNDINLFREVYVAAFLEGYGFALYLANNGSMIVFMLAIPEEHRQPSVFTFYWNKIQHHAPEFMP